jgi:hypothetical protein
MSALCTIFLYSVIRFFRVSFIYIVSILMKARDCQINGSISQSNDASIHRYNKVANSSNIYQVSSKLVTISWSKMHTANLRAHLQGGNWQSHPSTTKIRTQAKPTPYIPSSIPWRELAERKPVIFFITSFTFTHVCQSMGCSITTHHQVSTPWRYHLTMQKKREPPQQEQNFEHLKLST